jgi:membrane AbrB-like protein
MAGKGWTGAPSHRAVAKSAALTLAVAGLGGAGAAALHLPLGFLLGSLLTAALLSAGGITLCGCKMVMPTGLRQWFVPLIGLSIGGAFTPEVLAGAMNWWPSLLALILYIICAHALAYGIYRRGGIGRLEAFFGGVPGGLIESVTLGEEMGADVRVLATLQFLRLVLAIVAIPLIFLFLTGASVGSASGAVLGGHGDLTIWDMLVLAAVAGCGFLLARQLRFPAPAMTGPLLASALAHATGLSQAVPPSWMVSLTQVVIGANLGSRFGGMDRRTLTRTMGLSLVASLACMGLSLCAGWAGRDEPDRAEPAYPCGLCHRPSCGAHRSVGDDCPDRQPASAKLSRDKERGRNPAPFICSRGDCTAVSVVPQFIVGSGE